MPAVHLSPIGNGFQFLGRGGQPLLGGLLYTYQTNSATLAATYTTVLGNVANSNPITLLSDGRLANEVWLTEGISYQFQLYDHLGVLIGTYDDIYGINDLSVNAGALPATGVNFLQAGTGAVVRTVQDKERDQVSIKDFAASTSSTDNFAAIQAAIDAVSAAGGGDVLVPAGTYRVNSALVLKTGVRLIGQGTPPHISGTTPTAKLDARGGIGAAVSANSTLSDIGINNLWIDGTNALGTVSGLYLDATAAATLMYGVRIANCAFTNFGKHQILHDGAIFDVTYDNVAANNNARTADDTVRIQNTLAFDSASQLRFSQCLLGQYTAGKWCYRATAVVNGLTFIGGTIAGLAGGAGANGIDALGGISLFGTHMEGVVAQAGTIGLRYVGSGGGCFFPSGCFFWGRGVQIGDGTASDARGLSLAGNIGGCNATGADIYITAGGRRFATVGEVGYANGNTVIVDDRLTTDALQEITYMKTGSVSSALGTLSSMRANAVIMGPTGGVGEYYFRQTGGQVVLAINGVDEVNVQPLLTQYRANHVIQPAVVVVQNDSGIQAINQVNGGAAALGTLNNAPGAGDPTFWLKVRINGVQKLIPCW